MTDLQTEQGSNSEPRASVEDTLHPATRPGIIEIDVHLFFFAGCVSEVSSIESRGSHSRSVRGGMELSQLEQVN